MASASRKPIDLVSPAAAAVLVVVALTGLEARLDPPTGLMLLFFVAGGAVVLPWTLAATTAERRSELPSGATTTLIVASLVLVLSTLLTLAELLRADGGPGSTFWVSLVFAAVAAVPGWLMNSPVAALLSSAGLGVAFLALIDLVFTIDSITTFRWLLVIIAIAYAAVAAVLLESRRRHAVQHVSAAGIAITGLVLIGLVPFVQNLLSLLVPFLDIDRASVNGPAGWELVGLAGAAAVIAFGVAQREPGPGWIGAIALSAAVALASAPDGEGSLLGWPLVFILLALAAVAAVVLGGGGGLALPGRAGGDRPGRPRPSASAPAAGVDEPRRAAGAPSDEPRSASRAPADEPWSSPPPGRTDAPGPPPPPPAG